MEQALLIKLIFGVLLSVGGGILILIAYFCCYKYLCQERKCTEVTLGTIKGYTLASRGGESSGIHLPIVHYNVNGKKYKVVGPEYKGVITKEKIGLTNNNKIDAQENEQNINIKRVSNSVIRIRRNPMRELYPLHSEIEVFYCPEKPKLAYVLRYCNRKVYFWILFLSGIICLIIDLLILLLI